MSVPQSGGDSIVDQVASSVNNAAQYAKDTVLGSAAEAKKEGGKEQAKGNVPGQDSLSDRVSGAADAVSGKLDESKYDASSEANKRSI